MIRGTTAVYGLIGWPVAHSLSPLFQNAFFRRHRVDAVYVPFPVQPERVARALPGLAAAGVRGLNVTVPHKETVFAQCLTDEDAARIGAVNTLGFFDAQHDRWRATNTDWQGFKAVVEGLELALQGEMVLLFGAGGTARAVVHALADAGAHVLVCNRSDARREALLQHIAMHYPELSCEGIPWRAEIVEPLCVEARLLINTTAIGLKDGPRSFPFVLDGEGAAIDAVYRPDGHTPFCRTAHAGGRRVVDGLPMLIAQGAASFAWWLQSGMPDLAATLDFMQDALGRSRQCLPGWRSAGATMPE
ncbi:MAG: shikimate dehydrogenase [Zetaproteobacteria bacterium]|nr:MAG: shikimate dehydrogenase [Zetaproteobacteria bacterium]